MSYVVLARKWRPKYFEEVVGQEHVARTLINSIKQNRVAHAYLFCGTRGVGKTTTARILAKALNCQQGPTPVPCYECASCKEIHQGQSVDVYEIDGASNRGINEIRELREGVRYAPSRDRYKIYIIDEVHMLTNEAFNALLKTLEEPPAHAHFIFATTEPQKIPVTILSRCQRFDFKRIGQNDIVQHLQHLSNAETIQAEKAALQLIARQANGGMRDALSLMDQVISFAGDHFDEAQVSQILGVANRKHLFELSHAIIQRDAEAALLVLDEINRYGYDLHQFAAELVTHLRDLVVTAVVQNPERVTSLTENELQQVKTQVQGQPVELLHRYFATMADGAAQMARSPYPRLILEMTLVRLAQLEPLDSLDLLIDRLESLEGTLGEDAMVEVAAKKKSPSPPAPLNEPPAGLNDSRAASTDSRAVPKDSRPISSEDTAAPVAAAPPGPTMPAASPQPQPAPTTAPQPPAPARPIANDGGHALCPTDAPAHTSAELLASSPRERWRAVVEHLRLDSAPLAATCEHAQLEKFDDDQLILRLPAHYMAFFGQEERSEKLKDALHTLLGPQWTLIVRPVELDTTPDSAPPGDAAQPLTLAAERDALIAQKKLDLQQAITQHPTIVQARALFEPQTERVVLQLDE